MKKSEYMKRATELYDNGVITGDVYDAILLNANEFCDEDEDFFPFKSSIPDTYAEIEYGDFNNSEAISGAKWDDMNYLRYRER